MPSFKESDLFCPDTRPIYWQREGARAVVAEALSGRLLMRDAGRLLGVQPAKIKTFAEQLGG